MTFLSKMEKTFSLLQLFSLEYLPLDLEAPHPFPCLPPPLLWTRQEPQGRSGQQGNGLSTGRLLGSFVVCPRPSRTCNVPAPVKDLMSDNIWNYNNDPTPWALLEKIAFLGVLRVY